MKAIIFTGAGGPENLQAQELDTPQPAEGEVLIKTKAISINPVDVKTRRGGAFLPQLQQHPPVILGWDVAGDVVTVGNGVTEFKEGDKVFGMVNFPGHGRAYAECVAAPAAHLAKIPEGIDYPEAAATTLAALTAWQVLVYQIKLRPGQKLLVHAAAGGVGHFAVQMAKHLGATVVGTASKENHEFLRSLGADEVIDYTAEDFSQKLRDADAVLDPVGGETSLRSLNVLKRGGTLVSIVGGVKDAVLSLSKEKGLAVKNYLVHSSGEDMEQLAALLKSGALKPTVSHRFLLEQMADAHRQIETGKTRGKVVVTVS